MSPLDNLPQLRFGARTDQGYVRAENQDRMAHVRFALGEVYVVADGMGGHKGGAEAATMVIEGFEAHLKRLPVGLTPRAALRAAARLTNAAICARADAGDPALSKMGSTVVLLFVSARQAFVGHIGDSRAYLFRGGKLTRLTRDHTLVQLLVDRHLLTEEEARDHPDSSILARAMGRRSELDIEFSANLVLEKGDGILLCSDGLSGYVEDAEISDIIAAHQDPAAVADALVERALRGGGEDNVTVVYVELDERLAPTTKHALRVHREAEPSMRPLSVQPGEPSLAAANGPAERRPLEQHRDALAESPIQPGPEGEVPDTSPTPAPVTDLVPVHHRTSQSPAVEQRGRPWLPAVVGAAVVVLAAAGALLVSSRDTFEGVSPALRRHSPPSAPPTDGHEPDALALPRTESGRPDHLMPPAVMGAQVVSSRAEDHAALVTTLHGITGIRLADTPVDANLLPALRPGTVYFAEPAARSTAREVAARLGYALDALPEALRSRCQAPVVIVGTEGATPSTDAKPADLHDRDSRP